jgi:hypothetical protein
MSPIMSRTLSLAVWVVTWVVLCALASAPADACYACDRDLDPSPMALSRYDGVFVGRVIAVRLSDPDAEPEDVSGGPTDLVAEFAVLKSYKGELAARVSVASERGMPSFRFEIGRTYLVWAVHGEAGTALVTDACGRSSLEGEPAFDFDTRLLDDPSQMPTTPCADLNDEGRTAVGVYVDAAYRSSSEGRAFDAQIEWADRILAEGGNSASGCLTWIYREGMRGTGLWSQRSAPPRNGQWALAVLSRVDSQAAIPLWYERRMKLMAYPWDRIEVDLKLLALNDRASIDWVIGFLQSPPPLATYEARFAGVARVGIEELARLDYRPASGLLRRFRGQGYVPDSILDVYIAQFGRDVGSLEKQARESETAIAALSALARIDATSSLQRLGTNRSYPFRSEAKALLKQRKATSQAH